MSHSLLAILALVTLQLSLIVGSPHVLCAQRNSTPSAISRISVEKTAAKTGGLGVLKELSGSFEDITARAGAGVVQIFARTYTPPGSNAGGGLLTSQNSTSSGIIMSADGYILTNAHAVRGAHVIRVQMISNEPVDGSPKRPTEGHDLIATVVGIDTETDLAVIKVDRTNLPFLTLGDSDALKQGQLVLALGNPLGLENSVSLGIVSAVARQLTSDDPRVYIQTDAPINPGNSGGPLLDAGGRVVGINTFIMTQSGGSEGIGFAIPSKIARQVYRQLRTEGHVHRARLGLVAQSISPIMVEGLDLRVDHGVIVSDVDADGPSATAGIKQDDVITAVNGQRILTASQLLANVYRDEPGANVMLRVRRGADRLEIPVKTDEDVNEVQNLAETVDPVENTVTQLGIVGLNITGAVLQIMPDLRRPKGVLVAVRSSDSAYAGPQLQVGDAIYEINRQVIPDVKAARKMLDAMKPGDAVVLLIERDGHLVYLPFDLD